MHFSQAVPIALYLVKNVQMCGKKGRKNALTAAKVQIISLIGVKLVQ